MKVIIDRFEEELAVLELENGETVSVTRKILPSDAHEGAVVEIVYSGDETQKRREAAKKKMNSIFKK